MEDVATIAVVKYSAKCVRYTNEAGTDTESLSRLRGSGWLVLQI